jgi:hypothetical protein
LGGLMGVEMHLAMFWAPPDCWAKSAEGNSTPHCRFTPDGEA